MNITTRRRNLDWRGRRTLASILGLYTLHIAFAATAPNNDQYHGTAGVVPDMSPAVAGTGLAPRFQNFTPQVDLVKTGKGVDAGAPSIGLNWKTGEAMYLSSLTTFSRNVQRFLS